MADADLPSRFVSQAEIEETNTRKEVAWKAAYARIGQEPPKQPEPDVYDGRSLAEKLAANRAAKQEEYENSHKLSAQFRSLDPDEINFLDSVALKKFHEEQVVKKNDEEQLKDFRAAFETPAVQARDSALSGPPVTVSAQQKDKPSVIATKSDSKPINRPKPTKPGLKGVVVARKRPKPSESDASKSKQSKEDGSSQTQEETSSKPPEEEETLEGDRKRRRVE
ncbi:hypothetical protein FRC19_003872 [Serendipita sp. 401]|nr:hypothetical protein FRC19_003872 [Serendipita sp. 401]